MFNLLRFVLNHPLNTRHKWRTIQRVLAWQIASRLMTGPIAFPFVENSKLFAKRGMTGATGNYYCGLHEVSDMAFVLHALQQNELFLDVGANIGSYTVLAAAGPKARVISVEPIPKNFGWLQRNITLNDLGGRVQAYQVGLSGEEGTLRFSVGLDTMNHVVGLENTEESIEVPVKRLDDLVSADCPRVIKIDVEGHEYAVLRGAAKTLTNPELLAVVMETNGSSVRYDYSDSEFVAVMQRNGFSMFSYDPFKRELKVSGLGVGNTIFVRDLAAVAERVKAAPLYRVGHTTI